MREILVNEFEVNSESDRRSRGLPSLGYTGKGLLKDILLVGQVHGMSTVHHAWLLQSQRQYSAAGCGHHEGINLFVCDQTCKLAYAGEVVRHLNGLMIDEGEVVIGVSVPEEPRSVRMEQVD